MNYPDTMRAVAYDRASFDRTGEGKSNDRQHEENVRLIEYKRWTLVARKSDFSISAYGEKERPGWEAVLQMIRNREVDVVVAYHLDRLTRNMADLEKLILLCEEYNVVVATATGDIDLTNDTGRMVARILAAVARQEVERKAARQRLAHAQRRAEGRPWASVKILGYSKTGDVIEEEAAAIRQAMHDVIEERASLRELARRWTELELRSPYQAIRDKETREILDYKPWTASGVREVLKNPRIAGYITETTKDKQGKATVRVVGKGNWEPIVSDTEMTVMLAKFSDPSRRRAKDSPGVRGNPTNLLTGIMRCSVCGDTVRAGTKRGKPAYICGNWHTNVYREAADELVRSAVAAVLATVSPGSVLGGRKTEVDGEAIGAEITALRDRQGVLARSFARGFTSEEDFEAAAEEIAEKIKALEAQLTESGPAIDLREVRAESVANFLGQDMHEQRRVLDRVAVVTLHPVQGNSTKRQFSSPKRQVEVHVKGRRGNSEILIPAHIPTVLTEKV